MQAHLREAYSLAYCIESLREPYRQNAIEWLQMYTQHPMRDPCADILRFLSGLSPAMREDFIHHASQVLEEAVRYFGVAEGAFDQLAPVY